MTFDDIAEALSALGRAVAERGGDRSAIAATESFLRGEAESKPAAFQKAARKALKAGLRLPRATEVRGGAAAQSLSTLIEMLEAVGAKDSALKAVSGLRDFFAEEADLSLEALADALAEDRAATAARAKPKLAKA